MTLSDRLATALKNTSLFDIIEPDQMTFKFCYAIVELDNYLINNIPKSYRFSICYSMLKQDPLFIKHIKSHFLTCELFKLALDNTIDPLFLSFISETNQDLNQDSCYQRICRDPAQLACIKKSSTHNTLLRRLCAKRLVEIKKQCNMLCADVCNVINSFANESLFKLPAK